MYLSASGRLGMENRTQCEQLQDIRRRMHTMLNSQASWDHIQKVLARLENEYQEVLNGPAAR